MKLEITNDKPNTSNLKFVISCLFSISILVFSIWSLLPLTVEAATIGRPQNSLGLVGYWSFDVGKDHATSTTVFDMSGNGNTGWLTNATGSANWVDGKIGGGMDFDGTDDYVDIGDIDAVSSITISVWFKADSVVTNQRLVSKWGVSSLDDEYLISTDDSTSNELSFAVNGGGGSKFDVCDSNTQGTYSVGQWVHVVGVYENDDCFIYIDGIDRTDHNVDQVSGGMQDTSNPLAIGRDGDGSANTYFDGVIDVVRIYNRVLSQSEVERLYKLGLAGGQKFNATPVAVSDGLVGHWTFDGNQETVIVDSSGTGNDGYFLGGATSSETVVGVAGQAFTFDVVDNQVVVDDSASLSITGDLTMALWMYMPGTTATVKGLVCKQAQATHVSPFCNYGMFRHPSGLIMTRINLTSINDWADIVFNRWQHLACTFDDSVDTLKCYQDGVLDVTDETITDTPDDSIYELRIGATKHANEFYEGKIDDVRIYNRVLSADEIQQIYNATGGSNFNTSAGGGSLANGLVGHWTFDGPDITTADVLDLSGQGNHGDFIGGATTSAMTSGAIGQALNFDGDKYLAAQELGIRHSSGSNSVHSISTWFKTNLGSGASVGPISMSGSSAVLDASSGRDGQLGWRSGTGNFAVSYYDGSTEYVTASEDYRDGEWHHVAVVIDTTSLRLYVDGVFIGENTSVDADTSETSNPRYLWVGTRSANSSGSDIDNVQYYDGLLDDFRVYDRALTSAEITRLYNMGK